MSNILDLAGNFEREAKQQAENTKLVVSKEFSRLNKFINTEVVKSANETRNAMEELSAHHLSEYKITRRMLQFIAIIAACLGGMFTQVKYQPLVIQPNVIIINYQDKEWIMCQDEVTDGKGQRFCLPKTNSGVDLKTFWGE